MSDTVTEENRVVPEVSTLKKHWNVRTVLAVFALCAAVGFGSHQIGFTSGVSQEMRSEETRAIVEENQKLKGQLAEEKSILASLEAT